MRVEKYDKNHYKRIIAHCVRTQDAKGEYFERTNPSIDFGLTPYNYQIDGQEISFAAICNKIEEYKKQYKVRNTRTVLLASWIVQVPDNWVGDTKPFFEAMDKIMRKKFPFHVASIIHLDELDEFQDLRTGEVKCGREHMHYLFCPINPDKKMFDAKSILTKDLLNGFHTYCEDELEKELGYFMPLQKDETRERAKLAAQIDSDRDIINPGETFEYLPFKELKKRTQMKTYEDYMKQQEELENYKRQVADYKEEMYHLEEEVTNYRKRHIEEIIEMEKEYVPKTEVKQIITQIFDMLSDELPESNLRKYKKKLKGFCDNFGIVIDKLKDKIENAIDIGRSRD